jgi:hypothetical protein
LVKRGYKFYDVNFAVFVGSVNGIDVVIEVANSKYSNNRLNRIGYANFFEDFSGFHL